MPPKAKIPAPIDRPLSRAYLRKFQGWSTAYPPGMSDPTSLRSMENLLVTRDGAVVIRPGLRLVLFDSVAENRPLSDSAALVGSFEPFYLNDGTKAYLVARRYFDIVAFEYIVEVPGSGGKFELRPLGDAGFDSSSWPAVDPRAAGIPGFTTDTSYVRFLQIDNKILALSNAGEESIVFYVGETKRVPYNRKIEYPQWKDLAGGQYSTPSIHIPDYNWYTSAQTGYPTAAVGGAGGADSLASATMSENFYNYAAFFTYSNDLGESEPGQIGQGRLRRPWGGWLWDTSGVPANGTATTFPSGTLTTDPKLTADRLALAVPGTAAAGFDAAVAAGAKKLNFYLMSWSIQDSVPVEMQLVGTRDLTVGSTIASHGWFVMDPSSLGLGVSLPIPTPDNRYNSTAPPRAAQGLVAADRLVLVNDPTAGAVIRWSTNSPGENLNFAPNRGGGYKTLTTGNLQIPLCVKLWQNPQSVDTLTILNGGTDGYSTSYYMAPSTVTSQSDNTLVMGFEETTATEGTVSPYGCEVANNGLFHPLDDHLMKSTASNYNISHKVQTDQIANKWQGLVDKKDIVSCFHDQRLYYLVHNPEGAALEDGCKGNEVWVMDLDKEGGSWSRWLVQGVSLRKLQHGNRVMLSIARPEGIYVFDDSKGDDDYAEEGNNVFELKQRNISWRLETNTQGANRAHDAWSHLQQANLTVGNFTGTMEYGLHGKTRHGQAITKKKLLRQLDTPPEGTFDLEDMLMVKQDMREWYFFANSVEQVGEVLPSRGRLNLVQYRYTPVSVNVDYEHGSVETFEYGRDTVSWTADMTTINGVPVPFADTGRP